MLIIYDVPPMFSDNWADYRLWWLLFPALACFSNRDRVRKMASAKGYIYGNDTGGDN